ncbi:homeobox protein 2-like [Macrosteles quadrilineatus]|uniref:homeobox protein 2-like n=1 Tax=Macrosteles quadrilineatus TaxID=74068 RepID=UPI0023E0F2FB|nr:homeobox protein 2-like [Macrosteles quadrilineatus]
MEYLRKLKRYYERGIERNINCNQTEYLKDLLETSFEGPASRWLQLIRSDIFDWDHFAKEFECKYWSQADKRGIKAKIESEKYRANGTLSRTEYLTERVLLLQSISPSLSEEEIVSLLAERFDPIIQDSVNVQNITTIRAMERFLQKDDIRDGPKKVKSYNNSHQNSRPSSPNIQNPQRYHDRSTNQQAYVPKMNRQNFQHSDNYAQNNQHHRNQQNYRFNRNNGNESQQYQRVHRDYKPYQRDHYPDQNYKYNQNHPTKEQNQLCAMYRQNSNSPNNPSTPPMDPQLNSHHSSSRVSRSPQRSENHSAL